MIPEKGGVGGLTIEQNDNTDEGLALFAPIEVETGLIDGRNVIYDSVSPIANTGPIEFIVPRDNECSFILNQTRLSGHFIVETDKGEAVTEADKITLVNHFSACLFSQVEVYLNGTQICDLSSANSYPWKMFIQSYLTYSNAVKASYLAAEGYYAATSIESDDATYNSIDKDTTPAMFICKQLILNKKKVYFNTRLGVDFFHSDKFLPPNIDIKIRLIRNRETFGLRYKPEIVEGTTPTTKNYKIILQDLKLHMRKVLPTLQLRENYKARLLKTPCYIPYKSSKLRHFTIPGGVSSQTISNVANGILPKSIIFAMISNDAMNLHPAHNPFNFQHFKLTKFNVKRNGQNLFSKPIETDFENGNYVDLFRHMYDSLGVKHGNHSFGVTLSHFKNGKTFLVVDLTPDQCNSYHTHPDTFGNLDLELTFGGDLVKPIYVFAYMNYNSGIKIDQYQQVIRGNE